MAIKTWKFAGGWAFIKNGKRGWSKNKPKNTTNVKQKANKRKANNTTRVKNMAKKRSRRRSFLSVNNIMKYARIGALVAPAVITLTAQQNNAWKAEKMMASYTGYSPTLGTWHPSSLIEGWGPYIATSLITVGISKLNGIIRRL